MNRLKYVRQLGRHEGSIQAIAISEITVRLSLSLFFFIFLRAFLLFPFFFKKSHPPTPR
jgi:hypothetical protein